jgi:rubrerythrin
MEYQMTQLTRAQAIQTAIDAEKAATAFYARLARNTKDEEARTLLQKIASDEASHARQIVDLAERLGENELPDAGLLLADGIEIREDWYEIDNMTYEQALQIALDGEHHAVMMYEALAENTLPEVNAFFLGMARVEAIHAKWLTRLKSKLTSKVEPQ